QRHIGRQGTERRHRGLRIREVPRKIIRWTAWAFEHLAGIVGSVLDLVCGGERLHLRVREARAAGIGQIAESDQFERVAVGTNLLIDLKTALKLRLVITAKR